METSRYFFAGNTAPITDPLSWWDGTLAVRGAPVGTPAVLATATMYSEEILCESSVSEGGLITFFSGKPAIPIGAVTTLPLFVEVRCPGADRFAPGTATPQLARDAYLVPVTVPGSPVRPGTPYTHGIVITKGVLHMRPLSKTAKETAASPHKNSADILRDTGIA